MGNPFTALLREPLTYFLIAGGAVFLIWNYLQSDEDQYRIAITDQERARIAAQWQAQMARPPSDAEMAGLIDQFIREEIYYREALRMGLDRNDTIIRRRLAQKLGFLTEDIATASVPDEAQLQAFYEQHQARYREPERYSFEHRYFSEERRTDSEAAAADAIAALNQGLTPAEPGDPFMLQSRFAARSLREVAELFGSEFSEAMAGLEPGSWLGPLRSAYGWHAVRLELRSDARQPAYAEVASRVANDLNQQVRDDANERFYETLKSRYQIVGL